MELNKEGRCVRCLVDFTDNSALKRELMHFWINKAAGRNYDFGSRRYPVLPLPKNRAVSRQSRGVRSMVTPVHRFQGINSNGNAAGPSCQTSNHSHRPIVRNTAHEQRNRTEANVSLPLLQSDNITNNVTNAGNNQQILPNTTNGTNRGLLDFSEFSDAELAGYRLRCSVWIMFVLMTGFVAAAKFYFDNQGTDLEVLVFCGLLITLLMSGCFYSILCRRSQNHHLEESHAQDVTFVCTANTTTVESMREIPIVRQNPPPPYHIAILIPPTTSPEEAPPPSYDKIMQ